MVYRTMDRIMDRPMDGVSDVDVGCVFGLTWNVFFKTCVYYDWIGGFTVTE